MNNKRAIVHIKSSLAPKGDTVLFTLDPVNGFQWAGTSDMSADEILNYTTKRKQAAPKREEAEAFLREFLADGARLQYEVLDAAAENGIAAKTLRDAARSIGIIAAPSDGARSKWQWSLK